MDWHAVWHNNVSQRIVCNNFGELLTFPQVPSTGQNGPDQRIRLEKTTDGTCFQHFWILLVWTSWKGMEKSGCGQQTSNSLHSLTDDHQRALERGCISHPSVLPPPVIPLFLTPPPSFHPIPRPPCGSSIYQPPWFSLYLALWGSAAYIKYLETGGLVQQPGNLSTEREGETGRVSWILSLSLFFSATPGRGVSGRARRVGEPHSPPGYHWACVGGHHRVNSAVWMSKRSGSRCGERRGRQKRPHGKIRGGGDVWRQCGRKSSN